MINTLGGSGVIPLHLAVHKWRLSPIQKSTPVGEFLDFRNNFFAASGTIQNVPLYTLGLAQTPIHSEVAAGTSKKI